MSIAKRYLEINEQLKTLEKERDALRKQLLNIMQNSAVLITDGVALTLKDQERSTIDKEALTAAMGVEFVAQYSKTTQFKVLTAVKA